MVTSKKTVEYLVVDTSAFIQNAPLQNIGLNIITVQEVLNEINSRRQIRRLVVLPYDLVIKDVFPENVQVVSEFAKKTGDYPSLSATDIKVMALTYQLEKERFGTNHLREEPVVARSVNVVHKTNTCDVNSDIPGFHMPTKEKDLTDILPQSASVSDHDEAEEQHVENKSENFRINELLTPLKMLNCKESDTESIEKADDGLEKSLVHIQDGSEASESESDSDWITPSNIREVKYQFNSELTEEKEVKVACLTTDFAMQNVLKQMNLNVSALDGRIIKELRTFVLRCYTCFGVTSLMTKSFCPKCGNNTLKRVAVSLNADGKQQIHINARRPLTARGKKISLPSAQGGKHPNNPVLVADQPMPDQRPTRLARTKNNPLDDNYIAGYSPFVMRDVNSKSAQLCIKSANHAKHWMKKSTNESYRKRK